MPAYIIIYREGPIRDEHEYSEYKRISAENRGDIRPKLAVFYGTQDGLEGEAPEGVVMLEFPTIEDARTWYNSPGYQAALPHRLACAEWRTVLVDGVG